MKSIQEEGKKKFSWDWKFVVPASIVWMSALFISAIDFIFFQELKLKFPFLFIGMIFFIFGVIIRLYCRKTLKEQFSYRLQRNPLYGWCFLGNFGPVSHDKDYLLAPSINGRLPGRVTPLRCVEATGDFEE